MPLLTTQQLSNASIDADNLDLAVNGTSLVYVDRRGTIRLTLLGALLQLGYQPPITYTAGIVYSTSDADKLKTVEHLGVVYAPIVAQLPFTTSGTFETNRFRVVQGLTSVDLDMPRASNGVGFTWANADADKISVETALRHRFVLERAYRTVDLGKWGPAFQRLLSNPDCRYIEIAATQQSVFNIAGTVAFDRSDITIATPARFGATINLEGNDPYGFDLGGTTAVRFHNYFHNLIFTRNNVSASGAAIRLRNIYMWAHNHCRFYNPSATPRWWRHLEIISSSYGRCYESTSEFPIREHIYMSGGAGNAGAVGGWIVSNQWKGLTLEGGHGATANPLDQGCIVMDDHVAACWFIDVEGYRHKGYAFYGKGTLANRGRNILNLIWNPNIEATFANSGTARFDNFQGNQIRKGWSEGNECPALMYTANSASNIASDLQIGLKGTNADGVSDGGTNNSRNNMDYAGYTAGVRSGVQYLATVEGPIDTEFNVQNMALGVVSNAAAEANIVIRQMRYKALSSGPFNANLLTGGNNTIEDVVCQDNAATPYVTAAASISIYPGFKVYYVDGTTAIDTIAAGYFNQVIELRLRTNTASIRDLTVSGGNILLNTTAPYVSNGRGSIRLVWAGTRWEQLS